MRARSCSFFVDESSVLILHILSAIFGLDMFLRFVHGYYSGSVRVTNIHDVAAHYLT